MERATPLFAADDIDLMRDMLNGYLEPGSVRLHARRRCAGELRLSLIAGSADRMSNTGLSLFQLEIEPEMDFSAVELSNAYTVSIQLGGRNDVTLDGARISAAHFISSPGRDIHARFTASRQWLLRIGRATMDEAIRTRLGETPDRRLRFDPALRPDNRATNAWLHLVAALGRGSLSGLLDASPLAAAHVREALVHGLLDIQQHTCVSLLDQERGVAGAAAVRRATEFCVQNAANPITVVDIAAAAGIGVRTLQRTFRAQCGMTPLEYLREVRLRNARADLLLIRRGHAIGTVTEVALRWGFTHPGRFSQAYRSRYGEPPSASLLG